MLTSSNGNIFRVTDPSCGEFTGPGEFPAQRPVTRSFDVFFDLRLNKRLSKQPWGWWFETLSWSLWRHGNVMIIWGRQCYNKASNFSGSVPTVTQINSYAHKNENAKSLSLLTPCAAKTPCPVMSSHHGIMMTSSNRNIFRVTGPSVRGIYRSPVNPRIKASDAELWCFLSSLPEPTVE